MRLLNRKVTFKAAKLDRTVHILPNIHVHARRSCIGWRDFAVEVAFLAWAAGFRVERID